MAAFSVYAASQAAGSSTGAPISTTASTVAIDAGTASTAGHGHSRQLHGAGLPFFHSPVYVLPSANVPVPWPLGMSPFHSPVYATVPSAFV